MLVGFLGLCPRGSRECLMVLRHHEVLDPDKSLLALVPRLRGRPARLAFLFFGSVFSWTAARPFETGFNLTQVCYGLRMLGLRFLFALPCLI